MGWDSHSGSTRFLHHQNKYFHDQRKEVKVNTGSQAANVPTMDKLEYSRKIQALKSDPFLAECRKIIEQLMNTADKSMDMFTGKIYLDEQTQRKIDLILQQMNYHTERYYR